MTFEVNDGMVERARAIAIIGYFGQYRRDGVTPYIKHPEDVANRCSNNNERCVAWLHDIVEDTLVSCEALAEVFPPHIVQAVRAITKWPRKTEADYIDSLVACPLAGVVKLRDMASNLADKPTEKQKERYKRMTDIILMRLASGG